MYWLTQTLVPIAVTVVLPTLIVWIVFHSRNNRDNKNAEIAIKAIENNTDIDADKLVEALRNREKSRDELLRLRLLRGCIFAFIGIAAGALALIGSCYEDYDSDIIFGWLVVSFFTLAIGAAYLLVYFVSRKQTEEKK